jgi:hypothetical protein
MKDNYADLYIQESMAGLRVAELALEKAIECGIEQPHLINVGCELARIRTTIERLDNVIYEGF